VKPKTPLAHAISLAIAAAALGGASPASAQEQQTAAASESLEEIVVTGSRIRRDTYSAPQPMDVIAPEQAFVQGVGSVSALLQSATTAAGSPQVTAATSTAFVQGGGVGAQTLSLRGLGANRTLVLLNGRRAGPAGTRGEVSSFDFNVLPLSVIERVEILKDGASSIYGSDAVAGVVNIITKTDEGLDLDAYYGAPQRDGGEEARASFSWGQTYDRGRFRVTADYHKEEELARGDRSWFRCAEQYIFSPTTGERRDVVDPRTNRPACRDLLWGHVWLYNYQTLFGSSNVPTRFRTLGQFDYDGDLGNYIPPIAVDPSQPQYLTTPPGWYLVNYDRRSDAVANMDHPFQDAESLSPEVDRTTFFVDGEFDITDSVSAYGEVLLNRRKTKANGYRQYWSYLYTSNFDFVDFTPGVGGSELSEGWGGALWLSPTPITDHNDTEVTVDYQRFVAGLRGGLGEKWNWEVSGQYSQSDGDYVSDQIYQDSVDSQNFRFTSCVGETTAVRGVPCIDVPWLDPQFLAGNVPQEVREFLFGVEKGNTEYTQWTAEAYVTGPLFDLPAGPVSIAAGVQYQEDEIKDVPGEITLAGNAWGNTSAGITEGDDNTQAIFAEIEIPLVAGKAFAQALTLTASGRYTEVDSYGSGDTYKVGLNWQITDSWRVRVSQGTSFRTPALFELYLADQTSFEGQRGIDPCIGWGDALAAGDISQQLADNCAADGIAPDFAGGTITAEITTGGGLGVLEAETSESFTAGIVWTPKFAELSVSIDYFDIEVEDEVGTLTADQIVFGCYSSNFFPDDPLCDLFERRGPGSVVNDQGVDNIRASFININSQKNEGIDLSAIWRTALGEAGMLTLETQHTYQLTQERGLFEGTVEDLNGLLGEPKWVGRLNATFERGPWTFFWGINMVGESSSERENDGNLSTYRGEDVRVVLETDEVFYHNLSVTREFDKGLKAIFGVSNVLDEEPPQITTLSTDADAYVTTVGNSAFETQYDWYGRKYFINITKSF
jgi:outer membrane receptor protein involved in Fe transport